MVHKHVISDLSLSSLLDDFKETVTEKPFGKPIDLHRNISKNAPYQADSLEQLCSWYKMLQIFHFGISSENISTTKMKLKLNSIYNSGFWWILDFGELPPGNEKGSVITIIQFDVPNVQNVLNHIFYVSTTS